MGIDDEDFDGIKESQKIVENILNRLEKSGISSSNVILAGFSQGAALAAYAGLQYNKRLGGIVCMSGYLTHKDSDAFIECIADANKQTPVLICHGNQDNVVNPKAGARLYNTIKKANIPVEMKTYTGGHHSVPDEVNHVIGFIGKVFAN